MMKGDSSFIVTEEYKNSLPFVEGILNGVSG